MYRTDNPLRDFANHEAEQEEALKKLPLCEICEERIQDEYGICIDGTWYHEECFNNEYRKSISFD